MRVLLVEDEPDYLEYLSLGLEHRGIEHAKASRGEDAIALLEKSPAGHFDLVLLDIKLPGRSGWDLLHDLREAGNEIPVIFATALQAVEEKVRGLGLGADDYLVKPFEIDELVARIQAVLRRRQTLAPVEHGDVKLDLATRTALRGGQRIELSPREYDLLLALVRGKGEGVTREELLREVWNIEFDPGTNVLDVHVGRLRKKLDRHGRPLIRNERGKGYRILAFTSSMSD